METVLNKCAANSGTGIVRAGRSRESGLCWEGWGEQMDMGRWINAIEWSRSNFPAKFALL
jgi:hypothetical protein